MPDKKTSLGAIVVIPARFGSARLTGKPLVEIEGKTLLQRVWESVSGARETIIATDDDRILKSAEKFGGRAAMTSAKHKTGTERVAEVAKNLDADIIVNLQGDELFVRPEMIDELLSPFDETPDLKMSTLKRPIADLNDLKNPNIVKIIVDKNNFAVYFSRRAIPYLRDFPNGYPATLSKTQPFFRHIGIYAYRREFLLEFARWKETPLERAEKLEQLRALENGIKIKAPTASFETFSVDTPEELAFARRLVRRRKNL